MPATILDGTKVSAAIRKALASRVSEMARKGTTPKLAIVLVGNDDASEVYVRNKIARASEIGIKAELHRLPKSVKMAALASAIKKLNADNSTHGIIVQVPLPEQIDEKAVLGLVDPAKDVDGFHPMNAGLLLAGKPRFVPATPKGIIRLLDEYKVALEGRHAVIVGRSDIVGKPVAMLLLQRDCTVTICHSKTRGLADITRQADILVAAAGRPRFITGGMISEGAVVVDVGTSRINGKLVGDVDFEAVKGKASFITPVPGGIGPMTIAMLLENTVQAAG